MWGWIRVQSPAAWRIFLFLVELKILLWEWVWLIQELLKELFRLIKTQLFLSFLSRDVTMLHDFTYYFGEWCYTNSIIFNSTWPKLWSSFRSFKVFLFLFFRQRSLVYTTFFLCNVSVWHYTRPRWWRESWEKLSHLRSQALGRDWKNETVDKNVSDWSPLGEDSWTSRAVSFQWKEPAEVFQASDEDASCVSPLGDLRLHPELSGGISWMDGCVVASDYICLFFVR